MGYLESLGFLGWDGERKRLTGSLFSCKLEPQGDSHESQSPESHESQESHLPPHHPPPLRLPQAHRLQEERSPLPRHRRFLPPLPGRPARPHRGPDGPGRAFLQAEHRRRQRRRGNEPGDPVEADRRGQGIAGRAAGRRPGLAEGERAGGMGRGGSAHGGGARVRQEARVVGGVERGVRVAAAGDGVQSSRGAGPPMPGTAGTAHGAAGSGLPRTWRHPGADARCPGRGAVGGMGEGGGVVAQRGGERGGAGCAGEGGVRNGAEDGGLGEEKERLVGGPLGDMANGERSGRRCTGRLWGFGFCA